MSRPVLSTHVLDTSSGKPADGMFVDLFKEKDAKFVSWHCTATSSDGRIQFPFTQDSMSPGVYKLKFNTEEYFKRKNLDVFYPYVEVVFRVEEGQHYHVPLLLSPFGYSTYRGS